MQFNCCVGVFVAIIFSFPGYFDSSTFIRNQQLEARFSDTGATLIIAFDEDTDYGASAPLGGSFECPLLLDYPGATDLDVCSWTSGKHSRNRPTGRIVRSDMLLKFHSRLAVSWMNS